MNHRNTILALLAGIFFGGLAFFFLYQNASEIEKKSTPAQILVASDYIPPGVFLKSNLVEKKVIPESL